MRSMIFLLAVLAASAVVALAQSPAERPDPEPSPDLTPAEVIRVQVEALGSNDEPEPDAGIRAAFRFASTSNRAATGPLDRFTQMIKTGYADMLTFERAEYGALRVEDDVAAQEVTLIQADGRRTTYLFGLSRQEAGEYEGCWMTDTVLRRRVPTTNGLRRI
jgi:hypothetical protein